MPKIRYITKEDGDRILNRSFCQNGNANYKIPILAMVSSYLTHTKEKSFTIPKLAEYHFQKNVDAFDIIFHNPPIALYTKQGENGYSCSVYETNEQALYYIQSAITHSSQEISESERRTVNQENCILFNNQCYLITDQEALTEIKQHLNQPSLSGLTNNHPPEQLKDEFYPVSSVINKINKRIKDKLTKVNSRGEIYFRLTDGKPVVYTPDMNKLDGYSVAKDSYITHMSERSTHQTPRQNKTSVNTKHEHKPNSSMPTTPPANAFNKAFFYLLRKKSETAIRFTRQELAGIAGYFSENDKNNDNNAQDERTEQFIKELEEQNLLISCGNGEYYFNPASPKKPEFNNNNINNEHANNITTSNNTQTNEFSPKKRTAETMKEDFESPRKKQKTSSDNNAPIETIPEDNEAPPAMTGKKVRRNLAEVWNRESSRMTLSNNISNMWQKSDNKPAENSPEAFVDLFPDQEYDIEGLIRSPSNTI